MSKFPCIVCQECAVRNVPAYATLPRVTSDCKPWPPGGRIGVCENCGTIQKTADIQWQDEVHRIYKSYEIYHLSRGGEQPIFSPDGDPVPRSRTLVDFVVKQAFLSPRHGHLIDIGCGNGAAIANFSQALLGWIFDGTELSEKSLSILGSIKGFRTLYTGPLETIKERYDLVSMIHSLEHIPDPQKVLKTIVTLAKPDGKIFIEVPDIESSPFDLLVADHLSHFSRTTLMALASRCSLQAEFIENTVLPKEITLIGHRGTTKELWSDPLVGVRLAEELVGWLAAVISAAETAAESATDFGVFGTSVSGIWLYGALRDKVRFFVDEDISKIGGNFEGRPILSPSEVPRNATVFVPLVPATAKNVVDRLASFPGSFIPCPSF